MKNMKNFTVKTLHAYAIRRCPYYNLNCSADADVADCFDQLEDLDFYNPYTGEFIDIDWIIVRA